MKTIAKIFREEQNDSLTTSVSTKKSYATGAIRCADWGYSYVSVHNKNPSWFEKEFVFKKNSCGYYPEDKGDSLFHLRDSEVLQTLDFPVFLLNCDTDFRTPVSNAQQAKNTLFANKGLLLIGNQCAIHGLSYSLKNDVQEYLSGKKIRQNLVRRINSYQ